MRSWTRLRRPVPTVLCSEIALHGLVCLSFPRAAGCVGYDIVRATDAADHFVVIESWPSKGARLAHTLETDSYEESVYSDATVEEVFRGPGRLDKC